MTRCTNCESRRRPVHTAGLCARCYPWHRKQVRLQTQLAAFASAPRSSRQRCLLAYRVRVAERVLAEFSWRETQLEDAGDDPLPVLALLHAVAAECRSEVRSSVESELGTQSPEALGCFYRILLDIVENVPARRPRLHSFRAPKRGQCLDAWSEWAADHRH